MYGAEEDYPLMILYRFYYNFMHNIASGAGTDNPMGSISSSE